MVSCLPENGKVNLPLMAIFKHQANQGDITLKVTLRHIFTIAIHQWY